MKKSKLEKELEDKNSFEWALCKLKAGYTVRRKSWDIQGNGMSLCIYFLVLHEKKIIDPPNHDNNDKRKMKGNFGYYVENIEVKPYISRCNINGEINNNYIITTEDLLAKDWGYGYKDYKFFLGKFFEEK